MIIFAYQNDFGTIWTGNEVDPIELEFSAKDNVDTIVDKIAETWKSNPGNIDCLFLCAHGNSGVLKLGDDIGVVRAKTFAKLKGMFSANSRGIEIHGCACASPTDIEGNHFFVWKDGTISRNSGKGFEFLKSMAVSSGVKVTGSFQSISGLRAASSYIDVDTLTVNPNGSSYIKMRDGGIADERGATGSY